MIISDVLQKLSKMDPMSSIDLISIKVPRALNIPMHMSPDSLIALIFLLKSMNRSLLNINAIKGMINPPRPEYNPIKFAGFVLLFL